MNDDDDDKDDPQRVINSDMNERAHSSLTWLRVIFGQLRASQLAGMQTHIDQSIMYDDGGESSHRVSLLARSLACINQIILSILTLT